MKYCKNCWTEMPDEESKCPRCGAVQGNAPTHSVVKPAPAKPDGRPDKKLLGFCSKCGAPMFENNGYCSKCRAYTTLVLPQGSDHPADTGGAGWGVLGFLIPLVGLILFLVWNDTKPRTAKAAGTGALVAVILSVVGGLITFLAMM